MTMKYKGSLLAHTLRGFRSMARWSWPCHRGRAYTTVGVYGRGHLFTSWWLEGKRDRKAWVLMSSLRECPTIVWLLSSRPHLREVCPHASVNIPGPKDSHAQLLIIDCDAEKVYSRLTKPSPQPAGSEASRVAYVGCALFNTHRSPCDQRSCPSELNKWAVLKVILPLEILIFASLSLCKCE